MPGRGIGAVRASSLRSTHRRELPAGRTRRSAPRGAPSPITLASDSESEKWRRRPVNPLSGFRSQVRGLVDRSFPCRLPCLLHTSVMDRRFEEQLRIENTRWRRCTFVIMIGLVVFLACLFSPAIPTIPSPWRSLSCSTSSPCCSCQIDGSAVPGRNSTRTGPGLRFARSRHPRQ